MFSYRKKSRCVIIKKTLRSLYVFQDTKPNFRVFVCISAWYVSQYSFFFVRSKFNFPLLCFLSSTVRNKENLSKILSAFYDKNRINAKRTMLNVYISMFTCKNSLSGLLAFGNSLFVLFSLKCTFKKLQSLEMCKRSINATYTLQQELCMFFNTQVRLNIDNWRIIKWSGQPIYLSPKLSSSLCKVKHFNLHFLEFSYASN